MKKLFVISFIIILISTNLQAAIPDKSQLPVAEEVKPIVIIEPKIGRLKNSDEVFAIVTFSFVISPKGKIYQLEIEDSKFTEYFNKPMLKALKSWKFKPQELNGEPIYSQARLEILFTTRINEAKEFKSDC